MKTRVTGLNIILRDDQVKKNGKAPLNYQVTINGTYCKFSAGKEIEPKHFDNKKHRVKNSCPYHDEYNHWIINSLNKMNQFILRKETIGESITKDVIKNFLNNKTSPVDFYQFAYNQVEIWKSTKKSNTIKNYLITLKRLKEYRVKLYFSDIILELVEGFDNYLRTERKNSDNGVFGKHKCLKALFRSALKKNYLNYNPYSDYKFKEAQGKRVFLTREEVSRLQSLDIPSSLNHLEKVRDYFLFAVFTGLRYSDIEQLQWNNINLKANLLSLQMNKTGEELNIPIIAPAKTLLLKYLPKTIEKGTESVFPVLANQPTNRYLKELISLAKIDKRISFHCARHTFATLHIQAGTHLLNLRDLLGHKDVSVTQVYAKTLKQELINSMNSFSGLLEDTYPAPSPSLLKKIS